MAATRHAGPLESRGQGPRISSRLAALHRRPLCWLTTHPIVVLPSEGWSGSEPERYVCTRCLRGWVNFSRGFGSFKNSGYINPDHHPDFSWAGGRRHTYDEWFGTRIGDA